MAKAYTVTASELGTDGFTSFETDAKLPHYAMERALESLGYAPYQCVSKMDCKRSSGSVAVYTSKTNRGTTIQTVVVKN